MLGRWGCVLVVGGGGRGRGGGGRGRGGALRHLLLERVGVLAVLLRARVLIVGREGEGRGGRRGRGSEGGVVAGRRVGGGRGCLGSGLLVKPLPPLVLLPPLLVNNLLFLHPPRLQLLLVPQPPLLLSKLLLLGDVVGFEGRGARYGGGVAVGLNLRAQLLPVGVLRGRGHCGGGSGGVLGLLLGRRWRDELLYERSEC